MQDSLPSLLTVKETAAYLKVSERYVYRLCRDDILSYVRIGSHYRIITDNLLISLQKAFALSKETD